MIGKRLKNGKIKWYGRAADALSGIMTPRKRAKPAPTPTELAGTFPCESEVFNGPVCKRQCRRCKGTQKTRRIIANKPPKEIETRAEYMARLVSQGLSHVFKGVPHYKTYWGSRTKLRVEYGHHDYVITVEQVKR